MDPDNGSSVTLIYYRIGDDWTKEPFLNVVAAVAQSSRLTHVELAIGEDVGTNGMMTNVCRIFNDKVGAELVERTGRNPSYMYQSLGCSKKAVARMLGFARKQVGVPFSNYGMARSILWPRTTDGTSYFCAELVACVLKEGGLLEASSNPGAATPEMLYRIYKDQAAATANPYVLRDLGATSALSFGATMGTGAAGAAAGAPTAPSTSNAKPLQRKKSAAASAAAGPSTIGGVTPQERAAEREALLHHQQQQQQQRAAFAAPPRAPAPLAPLAPTPASVMGERRGRGDSPPRGHFRVITHCAGSTAAAAAAAAAAATMQQHHARGSRTGLQLTLNSLDMSRR